MSKTLRKLSWVAFVAGVMVMAAVSVGHTQGVLIQSDGARRGFDATDRDRHMGERGRAANPHDRSYPDYRYFYPYYGYSPRAYYYYCPTVDAYYPYVITCPDSWLLIPAS